MEKIRQPKRGYIRKIIAGCGRTPNGLVDMREFNWTPCAEDFYYREGCITGVDFSNSYSENYFGITGGTFRGCVFDNSRLQGGFGTNCKFYDCSFNGCSLKMILGGKFYDCSFRNLHIEHEHFSFGWSSIYKNCIFESVDINGFYDELGVRFEDCVISGVLKAAKGGPVYFHGRQFASEVRHDGILHLLFCPEYSPVRFIRCDLTGLKTKGIVFEKDVIFEDCKGMPSELKD